MMKYLLLLIALPVLLAGLITKDKTSTFSVKELKISSAVGCGNYFDAGEIDTAANGKFMVPLPGWGHYAYQISTNNDSAQFYFNQGFSMYYSYHFRESLASFKEAARFDPGCTMAYWGQALSMGPYYNAAASYKMKPGVLLVLEKMNSKIAGASQKEKALVAVMNMRYSSDTTDAQRPALNKAYAIGLKKVMSLFPDDPDLNILYIDAIMLMHAWNFWNNDGSPREWTPEVVSLCESVLKKYPEHPGALHYYIHLTEASRHPEVALHYADVLKDLLPGVAHMVHMSSHEYERNGLFSLGVSVNDKADEDLLHYDSLLKDLRLAKHSSHYFAVQAYCALSGGLYKKGIQDALRCRATLAPDHDDTYQQQLYMMPELMLVRIGKWQEILSDTATPGKQWPDALVMYHFARGMAFVNTGHADSAAGELLQLRMQAKDSILLVKEVPFNAPIQRVRVADGILNAAILFSTGNNTGAIASLRTAVKSEDSLIYSEPKGWMIPTRQFLGYCLLKTDKPALAEKVYHEDLVWNPGNGWSLLGIYQSLLKQHKNALASPFKARYEKAFQEAEQIPPASVYMN